MKQVLLAAAAGTTAGLCVLAIILAIALSLDKMVDDRTAPRGIVTTTTSAQPTLWCDELPEFYDVSRGCQLRVQDIKIDYAPSAIYACIGPNRRPGVIHVDAEGKVRCEEQDPADRLIPLPGHGEELR